VQLALKPLNFKVHILDLDRHRLIVNDQRCLLLLSKAHLLDEVFGGKSLLALLLAQRESLVGFNKLALGVHNHSLELVSLPHELLGVRVDLLLQLEVFFEKSVPLALTASLAPLVLLEKSALLA